MSYNSNTYTIRKLNAYNKANNKDATKKIEYPAILQICTHQTDSVNLVYGSNRNSCAIKKEIKKFCVTNIFSNILQFRDNMSASMSGLYGIFLSVLGVALPLTESFAGKPNPYMFEVHVLASCSFSNKCYIVSLIKKLLFYDILFVTSFSDFTFFFNILFTRQYWSVQGSYQIIWGPLSRMSHDILDVDHIQWHPPLIGHYTNFWPKLIWTLLLNLTFYLIVQGFHRTYATGVACQQRTLTPPDTWPCPTLGLACVLMSRPISPELVLSPNFWILKSLGTSLLIDRCREIKQHVFFAYPSSFPLTEVI